MFRNFKKLSRAKAADEIGITPSTMQVLEENNYNPRINTYRKVCIWLGRDMNHYFNN
jgi:DNA-binding XRE family transcriptional regulator